MNPFHLNEQFKLRSSESFTSFHFSHELIHFSFFVHFCGNHPPTFFNRKTVGWTHHIPFCSIAPYIEHTFIVYSDIEPRALFKVVQFKMIWLFLSLCAWTRQSHKTPILNVLVEIFFQLEYIFCFLLSFLKLPSWLPSVAVVIYDGRRNFKKKQFAVMIILTVLD